MNKSVFNAFFYSFAFTLSAIFIADKFCHTSQKPTSEIKITPQNITLFLKNENNRGSLSPQPVKKIALSVLSDIPQKEASSEDLVILADDDADPLLATPIEEESTLLADISLDNKTEAKPLYKPEEKAIQARVISIEDGDSGAEINLEPRVISKPQENLDHTPSRPFDFAEKLPIETEKNAEKIVAQNIIPASTDASKPNLLIPLEKSNDLEKGNKPKVIKQAPSENMVALADHKVSTQNMIHDNSPFTKAEVASSNEEKSVSKEWKTMDELSGSDNPWVVAQGAKHRKNNLPQAQSIKDEKEIQKMLEASSKAQGKKTIVAGDMVDNILIPLPQELKEKENSRPKLQFPEDRVVEEETEKKVEILDAQGRNVAKSTPKEEKKQEESSTSATTEGKGLLSSLTSIFSSGDKNDDNNTLMTSIKETFGGKSKKVSNYGKILPAEIRLSFQPNRAEISGNTLRWIDAFAQKTLEDRSIVLEIRLDGTTDQTLQRRRLNLLANILSNKGVSARDVNVVFTEREPNSFIIRTLRLEREENTSENIPQREQMISQW